MELLDETLRRLKTDYLDLLQLHDLRTQEDIDEIFSSRGAIHALKEAQQQGRVKFIGITGHHDPQVLIKAIHKHQFDTLLVCANASDPHYLPFITTVIPEARKKKMGVIGMKVLSRGDLLQAITVKEALYYTWSQDVDLAIIGCNTVEEITENATLAAAFKPLSNKELAAIEARTKIIVNQTSFFKKGMY